jgi:hypothetical protein
MAGDHQGAVEVGYDHLRHLAHQPAEKITALFDRERVDD